MAAVKNPLETFFWGEGGAALTPEQIASRRKVENAILARGVDTSPVGHWTQGLARVADALAGSIRRGQLDKAEQQGNELANSQYSSAIQALGGGSSSTSSAASASAIPMTSAAGEVSATSPTGSGNYRDAIASIESAGSGDYNAVGPTHPKMGRALGRYQIMESNIGPWSQAALGRAVSPDEFMANPKLQDAIFDHQFGQYVQKYGPEGAAQAWLGGPGGVGQTGRKDSLGTSIGEYGNRFMKALGPQVASLDPAAGMSAPQAIETAAPASGYIDPMVSVQPSAEAPPLSSPQTVAPSPAVAQVAQQVAQGPVQSSAPNPLLNEAIVKAMSSPYMSEGQRSVVDALLKQRMAEQQAARDEQNWRARQTWTQDQQRSDPAYQLDQDYKRAQLDALKGKPSKTWQKLDDTTLFNPETGETQRVNASAAGNGGFRFEGKSVEAQALNGLMDTGTLTPAQAQQLGAGKTITGPNGEIIFMTPQGVFGQSANGTLSPMSPPQVPSTAAQTQSPGGVDIFGGEAPATPAPPQAPQAPQVPQRQGMIPLTEPKVTIDESKAGGFADRMTQSGDLVDQFGDAGLNTIDQALTNSPYVPGFIANNIVGKDFQQYDQARRDFINAQLRRESGAVISPEEFDNANKQYFPQPGDKPDVLEQKRKNRETVIGAMIRDAGPTYKPPAGKGSMPKAIKTQSEYEALPSGSEFIAPDGRKRRKP